MTTKKQHVSQFLEAPFVRMHSHVIGELKNLIGQKANPSTIFFSVSAADNMAIFYFIDWIVAVGTIEGGKLFKGGNYSRKYSKYIT